VKALERPPALPQFRAVSSLGTSSPARRIAFIGDLPVGGVFPDEVLRPRSRGYRHPAPWIVALLPALARVSGYELRMVMVHRGLRRPCVVQRDGVTYEGVPVPWLERWHRMTGYWTKVWAARRAMHRFQPDLIHAFGFETGAATDALRTGFPVSCFIQGIFEKLLPFMGHMPAWPRRVALTEERRAARRVRWMVAENDFARTWALGHHPEARVVIIPHALRACFLEAAEPTYGRRLVVVASLMPSKGVDTVLRAFARVEAPEARLVVAGEGVQRPELEALARELGLGNRVEFTGGLGTAAVIEQMRSGCGFLCASRMDFSPNTITEAHAVGLPVIATRAGGIPDMIEEGADGFLVDVDDAATMAARMQRLLREPDLARRLGQAGRAKVSQMNDADTVARAHVALFQEAFAATDGARRGAA
jgi:glycosyltransferase involved in cell wall biosynthesis